jgi:hypothetical protein
MHKDCRRKHQGYGALPGMEFMQSLMQAASQIKTGAGSSQPRFDLNL